MVIVKRPAGAPALAFALSLLAVAGGFVLASGGERIDVQDQAKKKSPEVVAAEHYNEGLADRDQAWALQEKADDASLSAEKREALAGKIRRAYERAIGSFTKAVEAEPRMYRAWGSLGYSRRQTGDYAAALEAYDRAIALQPDYAEALEYRGEAYLGLNRIADARASYESLEEADAALAQELLSAMDAWIDQRRAEPAGVKVGELDAFERWVGERLTGEPVASTSNKSRHW